MIPDYKITADANFHLKIKRLIKDWENTLSTDGKNQAFAQSSVVFK